MANFNVKNGREIEFPEK